MMGDLLIPEPAVWDVNVDSNSAVWDIKVNANYNAKDDDRTTKMNRNTAPSSTMAVVSRRVMTNLMMKVL